MSKQQRAPGSLELVRDFVNTFDTDEGGEQLRTAAELADWFRSHELLGAGDAVKESDLRHAIALREAIRALLLAHNGGGDVADEVPSELDSAARRARITMRFGPDGSPLLEPAAPGVPGALGRLLTIVHASIAEGTWSRLKACRDETCQWAFYDHTKNRSGAWCNMAECGNRAKARAYRGRHPPTGNSRAQRR